MKHLVAAVLAVIVAAALAAPALADSDGKTTLGPAGYSGPGAKRSLVVAGTANVVLDEADHVVICHAIGGPNGSRFNQIAPSAQGVASGHGDHQGDRDIIPPFTLQTHKGSDATLASGQTWNAANAAIYANGCSAPTPPITPPTDVCPNIDGIQTAIPAGMSKDSKGNCVTPPPTDVCPNIDGIQTAIPAGMSKDSAGNCVTPQLQPSPPTTTTVTIEKVVVVKQVIIKKVKVKAKVKKVAKKKKAKKKAKIKVKAAHKVIKPSVLPHTR
jgi:hypothetical protein